MLPTTSCKHSLLASYIYYTEEHVEIPSRTNSNAFTFTKCFEHERRPLQSASKMVLINKQQTAFGRTDSRPRIEWTKVRTMRPCDYANDLVATICRHRRHLYLSRSAVWHNHRPHTCKQNGWLVILTPRREVARKRLHWLPNARTFCFSNCSAIPLRFDAACKNQLN